MAIPVVKFDIGCRDKDAIRAFYEDVFGWKATEEFGPSFEMQAGEGGIDGSLTELAGERGNYVMVYCQVDDVDAYCEKIKAAGGDIAVGPIDIPAGKGRFAWFTDPEGARLAIWQP